MKTCVLQADLAREPRDATGLADYGRARILIRYGPHVVGEVSLPVEHGVVFGSDVRLAALADPPIRERVSQLIVERHVTPAGSVRALPSWTVVVCTRERTEMLKDCLDSLTAIPTPDGEIIVVDNAPTSDGTRQLVSQYPSVRYAIEDRVGLNRARMRGAELASGEVVAYADDDTVADPGWIAAILAEFDDSRVGSVTGLTMPFELETQAQEDFELYGGFRRGFRRRVFDFDSIAPAGSGTAGSGANMAFRRDLVVSMGLFRPHLDLGTPSRTGGDAYALARVLTDGYRIVYSPDALNWHRHRRTTAELNRTLAGYGTGLYAFLTKQLVEERDLPALRVGLSWFRRHHMRELARTLLRRPDHLPLGMILAEIRGTLVAPIAYLKTRRAEKAERHVSSIGAVEVA